MTEGNFVPYLFPRYLAKLYKNRRQISSIRPNINLTHYAKGQLASFDRSDINQVRVTPIPLFVLSMSSPIPDALRNPGLVDAVHWVSGGPLFLSGPMLPPPPPSPILHPIALQWSDWTERALIQKQEHHEARVTSLITNSFE